MRLPPDFGLHEIDMFVRTAELGSMSASATALGITQSAVSQAVARLETSVGVMLFDRSKRPLALTLGGRALLEHGRRLIADAERSYSAVRAGGQQPLARVHVAMSESLATQLTAPLLARLGHRAEQWLIRSGLSLQHHGEFLARKIDVMVTGSPSLDQQPGLSFSPVLEEQFILLFPQSFREAVYPLRSITHLPFIRYGLHSSMGQRIEGQLARMKLELSNVLEVETTSQQFALVAAGLGWSITSPLCLACQTGYLPVLRVEPMQRARFSRNIQIICRAHDLGDLPEAIAQLGREQLRHHTFPALLEHLPWLADQLRWPDE